MRKGYIIGVDIGGTNTDAVLIDENRNILHTVKTATTKDISQGFRQAIFSLCDKACLQREDIDGVYVGTTHATNAILQNEGLCRVGVIRIAGQRPDLYPAGYTWPEQLKQGVIIDEICISGGFECHGAPITSFDEQEAKEAIYALLDKNVESLAVVGVFSPLNPEHEEKVASLVFEITKGQIPTSLSYKIGGIGFMERENGAIINASLRKVISHGFYHLKDVCKQLDLEDKLFITQNNGCLIEVDKAIDYPILTVCAGQTNSLRGGAKLLGVENAIVVDIGGTSTDIGVVKNGFAIKSLQAVDIGGIKISLPMPDTVSIALGGASILREENQRLQLDGKSLGKDLFRSRCFGGDTLTLTDAAVASGQSIDGAVFEHLAIGKESAYDLLMRCKKTIDHLVAPLRRVFIDYPVVFVGGGSVLLRQDLFHPFECVVKNAQVANAFGAALSEISGTIDTIASLTQGKKMIDALKDKAQSLALKQGAKAFSLRLIEEQVIPYPYAPEQLARVVITYCGSR